MFNQKQIEFMKEIGLDMNFSNLTDDDYIEIENKVGDTYTEAVEDNPDRVTPRILMCESILDSLN